MEQLKPALPVPQGAIKVTNRGIERFARHLRLAAQECFQGCIVLVDRARPNDAFSCTSIEASSRGEQRKTDAQTIEIEG